MSHETYHYSDLSLQRLCRGRSVGLFAHEFGPALPITRNASICARFFRPWILSCHVGYLHGQYSIEIPLSWIIAGGQADSVLKALKGAPDWLAQTLLWPHSVLGFLVGGDRQGARDHLKKSHRWAPGDPSDWTAAGIYWSVLLDDRKMAASCFDKAEAAFKDREHSYHGNYSLVEAWAECCGDAERARSWLSRDLPKGSKRNEDALSSCVTLIASADAAARFLGDRDRAASLLDDAAKVRCKGADLELSFKALAWIGILGDEARAASFARRGLCNRLGSPLHAALYWLCFADDPATARQCIWNKYWADYPSVHFRLSLAKQIVMFHGLDSYDACLRQADSLIQEVVCEEGTEIHYLKDAAVLCSQLLEGKGTKEILGLIADRAKEPCDWITTAEAWREMTHVPIEKRRAGCIKMLRQAESVADSPIDYSDICAYGWKTLVGDNKSSERCLIECESCDKSKDENESLANLWSSLLGRADRARALLRNNPGINREQSYEN